MERKLCLECEKDENLVYIVRDNENYYTLLCEKCAKKYENSTNNRNKWTRRKLSG